MMIIWNPWHGCKKVSEGCEHCYMYYLDAQRGMDGSVIYKIKNNFDLPLKKNRQGNYKIISGQTVHVCLTSDFFLEEADCWRDDIWSIMRQRSDVNFVLLTKRPERIEKCLPKDWGIGWDNVSLNVTAENQKRADERIPILLDMPFRTKGIMAAPLLSEIRIEKYLATYKISQVMAGGENYDGARECHYEWVKLLYDQCVKYIVPFSFNETGSIFVKEGKKYIVPRFLQHEQAIKSGLNFPPHPLNVFVSEKCKSCDKRFMCKGCNKCGRCNDF